MNAIHDICFDILPDAVRLVQEMLLARELIGIVEAHHGLRLRPPVLFRIDHYALGIGFVEKAAVLVETFLIDGLGHAEGQLTSAIDQRSEEHTSEPQSL